MASLLPLSSAHFLVFSILFCFVPASVAEENDGFVRATEKAAMGLKKEKLSHFRFYWHDIQSGQYPTSMKVLPPVANASTTAFGQVNMIDNPLMAAPALSSRLVGRAQGFYALSSQHEVGLLMAMNFAFVEGKYNGSSFTVLGRNPVFSTVREMPVVGGSGLFRFARGYVELKTNKLDVKTGDAIVEYNAYVLHY